MHYQVIVEFAFSTPLPPEEGSDEGEVLGYVQTFGVNAPDHATAIGKVQDWIKREEDIDGFIAGIDCDRVELEDWPDEVRDEFSGDPAQLGVYFATGRVNFGEEDTNEEDLIGGDDDEE